RTPRPRHALRHAIDARRGPGRADSARPGPDRPGASCSGPFRHRVPRLGSARSGTVRPRSERAVPAECAPIRFGTADLL
ncbi:hypothetical protein, partial [Streptomyces malaysiensis]